MEQREMYKVACELLDDIKDVPMNRFTFGEALFLFRHCLRNAGGKMNVIAAFDGDALSELITIVRAVRARGGPTAIH